ATDVRGFLALTRSVAQNSNYTAATSAPFPVTLNRATPTITVTGPVSVTYGSTGTATATVTPGAGTPSFSAGSSTGCSVSGTTVKIGGAACGGSLTESVAE